MDPVERKCGFHTRKIQTRQTASPLILFHINKVHRRDGCCHTEREVADQTHLGCADTGPPSCSTDCITPDIWQGSHWSTSFKSPLRFGARFEPQHPDCEADALSIKPSWRYHYSPHFYEVRHTRQLFLDYNSRKFLPRGKLGYKRNSHKFHISTVLVIVFFFFYYCLTFKVRSAISYVVRCRPSAIFYVSVRLVPFST